MASSAVLRRLFPLLFLSFLAVTGVNGLASTDTITWGGDVSRSGYQNNHNMDPAIVGSAQFGLLYKTLLPGTWPINGQNVPEQIFSQPLVYTGSDGVQYVYIATTQNNVYKMNARTGVVVLSRKLHRPFLASDLDGCVDINPTIGVTATGVIDPDTDTWHLTAKTYVDQNPNGPTGRPNSRYYVHAISTVDLTERPSFPVNLEGMVAVNNPVRSFNGGIQHQRPALLHYGQYIYAGFASHCVQYNFTGWIVGWDKTTGALVERFATEGAGVANTVPGAGVWMSGGGLASDGKGSMFFATGNGYASQLNGVPVNGRNPPTSLEEAAVHMAINDDGSLTVVDFFMPWEKVQLDGADRDLGTSPLELLPSQFQCGNISRMGVVTGKSGKTYWLDLDNLGGYQNGPNKLDNVIQVYQNENSVYAGAGVYPLEGGFIYINVIQYKTHVFKFNCNNGVPSFNEVADSPENNAYILGVGHGTVTSLNDQPGTGLVWTSDVEGSNLRIYNAIPNQGVMTEINSFVTPGTTKFTRPVFGDGMVFQGTTLGYIYAYGSPVSLPLNCTAPNFGSVNLNSTSPKMTIQCIANTALTVTAAALSGNPNFALSGLPTFPIQVAAGMNFSFQAAFAPVIVGPLASSVILNTTQQTQGYSINTPIQLKGTGQSQAALLMVSPVTVAWNGVITGQQPGGVNQTVILQNLGDSALSISKYQFSVVSETGPWLDTPLNSSNVVVSTFSFFVLPSSIPPNSAITVPINFNPSQSGDYAIYVQVTSNGGTKVFDVVATGSDYPVAVLEFQRPDGSGWVKYDNSTPFIFGNVTENTSRYLKMRLTNNGTANAAAISVTVSKPPFAVPGIIGASNQVDLAEGSVVYAGQNLTATLYCSAPKSQIDVDPYNGTAQWTMNLNDPTFGKRYIQFFCNAVSQQAPPLNPVTKQALYRYAGCFVENDPGRELQTNIYSGSNNTNENCISMCSAAGYIFAGTQYNQECWCGNNRPKTINPEANCNFVCTGDINEICGGNGISGTGSFISLFGDITRWDGNTTNTPGPYINPGTDGFVSIGCYTEGTQGRALNAQPTANNTVSSCLQACQGYLYSGVEFGGQCFCGNTLGVGSVSASASDCGMTCNNNQTELCGGPNRLSMYIYSNNGSLPNITNTPSNGSTGNLNNGGNPSSSLLIPSTIGNFNYVSCYTEATNGRALTGFALADNSITLQTCAGNCTNYKYFGVEYGRECYCGQSLSVSSLVATDGRCNMPCAANSTEACGGPNGLTLFAQALNMSSPTTTASSASASATSKPSPTIVSRAGTFAYVDCHSEVQGRALTAKSVASNNMTIPYCASYCTGFTYMAVEYSQECYCGNALSSGSVTVTDGRCSMACANDSSSICGGPNGLTLYQLIASSNTTNNSTASATASSTPVLSPGFLFNSSNSSLQLSTQSSLPPSYINSTTAAPSPTPSSTTTSTSFFSSISSSLVSNSTITSYTNSTSSTRSSTSATTTNSSSPFPSISSSHVSNSAITSYANGTSSTRSSTAAITTNSSSPFPSTTASFVNTTTIISSTTSATDRMSLFTTTLFSSVSSSLNSSSSTPTTTTTHGTTLTTSTSITAPASPTGATGWNYLGCANETNPRALSQASTSNSSMTIETCQAFCLAQNLPVAGLEYSRECYCGLSLANNSTLGFAGCTSPCAGNASEICGGSSRLSVYNYTLFTPPQTLKAIGNYRYQGCFTEANPRVLNAYAFSANNMTEEYCVSTCQGKGLKWAGVEYGVQCYCDNRLSDSATLIGDGQCNMLCGGNQKEYCGAGNRIGVFANV